MSAENITYENEFFIKNFEDLDSFAGRFLNFLSKKVQDFENRAVVVGLSGDLGSGKTTFSKKMAEKLGILENITSPTFVIQKSYKTPEESVFSGVASSFVHIDAYRLESSREIEVLGWVNLINSPKTLVFIEWPEKVQDVLPKNIINLKFDFIDDNTRKVSYNFKI